MGIGHGHRLAPVAGGFDVGAAGCDICAAGRHFAGWGSGPVADGDTAARAACSSVDDNGTGSKE